MIYKFLPSCGQELEIKSEEPLELEVLQLLVGGNIEVINAQDPTNPEKTLVINEDGLRLKLRQNPFYEFVVGNVIEVYLDDGEMVGNK